MQRLHVHIRVADLTAAVRFYSGIFGAEPTVRKADYAKWQLDDPSVNFAISDRGTAAGRVGLEHLGVQADDAAEFAAMQERLVDLGGREHDQQQTTCCYAVSDKSWVRDPAGVMWELFHTVGEAATMGAGPSLAEPASQCCDPATAGPDAERCC